MGDDVTLLKSSSGYTVSSQDRGSDGAGILTITAPDGRLCLRVQLRPEGLVLDVEGQAIRLASAGQLRLDCDSLAISAAREVSIETGALRQVVGGDVSLQAGGVIDSEGHAQRLRARLGDIELAANDDVSLDGERVRLNSPKTAGPVWPLLPPTAK